jgi:hypothetical protein
LDFEGKMVLCAGLGVVVVVVGFFVVAAIGTEVFPEQHTPMNLEKNILKCFLKKNCLWNEHRTDRLIKTVNLLVADWTSVCCKAGERIEKF